MLAGLLQRLTGLRGELVPIGPQIRPQLLGPLLQVPLRLANLLIEVVKRLVRLLVNLQTPLLRGLLALVQVLRSGVDQVAGGLASLVKVAALLAFSALARLGLRWSAHARINTLSVAIIHHGAGSVP